MTILHPATHLPGAAHEDTAPALGRLRAMPRDAGPPRLADRTDAKSAGARGRRYGFPREYAARYAAVHGEDLAEDWRAGWDAEDRHLRRLEAERAARQAL